LTTAAVAKDVFQFASAIRDCATLEECRVLFRGSIARYGFDGFASGEVDTAERSRSMFYMVDWPKRMFDFYVKSGYVNKDPLFEEIKRLDSPFTWSELRRDRLLSHAGAEMLGRVALEGWTESLVVPFPRGGTRFGIVTIMGGRGPVTKIEKDGLAIVAMCLLERARSLGPGVRRQII
jgi:hypothetical protein